MFFSSRIPLISSIEMLNIVKSMNGAVWLCAIGDDDISSVVQGLIFFCGKQFANVSAVEL